jgi:hypothetical protein
MNFGEVDHNGNEDAERRELRAALEESQQRWWDEPDDEADVGDVVGDERDPHNRASGTAMIARPPPSSTATMAPNTVVTTR